MTKAKSKYKSSMEHCPYTCITSNEKALTNKDLLNLLNKQDLRIQELEECIEFARDIIELNCGMEQIDEFHKIKEKIGMNHHD